MSLRVCVVRAFWVSAILAVVATSQVRAEEAPAEAEQPGELFPLSVGSFWTYVPEAGGDTTTERLVEMKEVDGVKWFLLKGGEPDKPADAPKAAGPMAGAEDPESEAWEMWIANFPDCQADADLIVEDPAQPPKVDYLRKYYRYPVEAGQTYRIVEGEPMMMLVMSIDEMVQTPAGEFKCIIYKEIDPSEPGFVFTSYVAPGVGVVKTEILDGGELSTDVLKAYKIPAPNEAPAAEPVSPEPAIQRS